MDRGNRNARCGDAVTDTVGNRNADPDTVTNPDPNAVGNRDRIASTGRAGTAADTHSRTVGCGNAEAAGANDRRRFRAESARHEVAGEEESRLRALRRTRGDRNADAETNALGKAERGTKRNAERRTERVAERRAERIADCVTERITCEHAGKQRVAMRPLGRALRRRRAR